MHIRAEADQGAERRHEQRQGHHGGNEPGGHTEFHDHHPVQGADQQGDGNAAGHLEEGEAQQAQQRQIRTRDIGERHQSWPEQGPERLDAGTACYLRHARSTSSACEI